MLNVPRASMRCRNMALVVRMVRSRWVAPWPATADLINARMILIKLTRINAFVVVISPLTISSHRCQASTGKQSVRAHHTHTHTHTHTNITAYKFFLAPSPIQSYLGIDPQSQQRTRDEHDESSSPPMLRLHASKSTHTHTTKRNQKRTHTHAHSHTNTAIAAYRQHSIQVQMTQRHGCRRLLLALAFALDLFFWRSLDIL